MLNIIQNIPRAILWNQSRARIEAYEFKGSTYWRLEDKNHRFIENMYEGTRLRDFVAHTRTIGFELINYKERD